MSVDYEVLNKFLDVDTLELEYHRVTNDIRNIDIEYGIEIIFKYYRKFGFPHYKIREEEKYEHMRKLKKFDIDTILVENHIVQTMHCLRLAWTYFPHFWEIRCGNAKQSPMEIFHDDKKFKSTIRKCWNWSKKHFKGEENQENNKFHENRLRQSLKIYTGTQSVSNFRPTAAALMYDKFLEKASPLFGTKAGTTWDMSCGYGGRLLGSSAADVNYIGTDPCGETFEGLKQIKEDWGSLNRTIELHQMGSEEFRPDYCSVDLCFTSPPYFDWEKYSQEETQSYKKYPTSEEWLNGFLLDTIDNCHYALKPGGILAFNVANTRRIKNFEDETLRLAKMIHFKHIDTWKLQLSSQQGTPKSEPIFIFQK